jgi:molybdate/tungstate transport system substrate-binding protein
VIKSQSITYGATMIKKGANREAAKAFLTFYLSPDKGLKILPDLGRPPSLPARFAKEAMRQKIPVFLGSLADVG